MVELYTYPSVTVIYTYLHIENRNSLLCLSEGAIPNTQSVFPIPVPEMTSVPLRKDLMTIH
jgi:hypothetical protein